MKILIIEDEHIAAQSLQRQLLEIIPDAHILQVIQSIEEAVEFFNSNESLDIDIIFMDIHLADGLAFHIFEQIHIDSPLIFTTAYDQYALEAFKVGGIDYLLKPINKEDLERAIKKIKRYGKGSEMSEDILGKMKSILEPKQYKSVFLIPVRDKLIPLDVDSIAYIYVDGKLSRAVTFDGKNYIIDKPLDGIHAQLPPKNFFRANRQYIISRKAVAGISLWPLSKLHIELALPTPEKIIVSRARVSEFKDWYTT